jgi:uncharacterized protein (TIGR02611 family)
MDVQQKATDIKSSITKFIRVDDIPWLRKTIVAVIGLTVVLIGLAMTILPGPAILVIPLGIAILATEFVWAQRLLRHAEEMVRQRKLRPNKQKSASSD